MTLGRISSPVLCPVVHPQQRLGWGQAWGSGLICLRFSSKGGSSPLLSKASRWCPQTHLCMVLLSFLFGTTPPLNSIWKRKMGFMLGPLVPDSFL